MNSLERKLLVCVLVAIMTTTAIGCGNKYDANATIEDSDTAETKEEEEVTDSYISNLESFDSIISQLKSGQAYALVDIGSGNEALLVASGVYDNGDGNMAAIDAMIYGYDADHNIIQYGQIMSDGTAYPLSVKDGYLYFGGGHHVEKEYIDESVSSIITKEDASETFDEDGKATYYYFSLDNQFEGEVEDDSKLTKLFDEYADADVINFITVK